MATKIEVIKRWLTLRKLFMISWLLRILLILYGELQDKVLDVKFTDIDYKVFSDAAGHVLKGNSPYDRHTYRYTPIVAWLLIPNHILFYGFGKLVFVSFDVLAGWIMYKILSIQDVPEVTKMICCVFWLLNPLTAVVSSRGNAESIMALLLVLCIYTLMSDSLIVSAVLYGTAVHMKIYPIIYSLSIVLNIDQTPWERVQSSGKFIIKWNLVFTRKKVTFVFVSVTTFLTITGLCYLLYGWEFLYEAFIYHVVRTDIKHNFSVYFYMLYLTQGTWVTPIISLATFLPQFMLVFVTALKLHRDLPFCCFVQTFLFVTFNKVCTSQVCVCICMHEVVHNK